MNRKVVMILTLSGTLVLMLLIIVRVAQYLHIRSFKTAAADLIETGTGGRYMLQFGETEVDYVDFSLTIEDLVVKKKDSTDIKGIMQVQVPGLIIDLGSITRVLTSNQFKIDKLSIREPVATIGVKEKSDEASQPDPLNVPHQIARFYPVVKTILEHFDIALFQIDRAALKLEKSHDTFQVRLLDLLVSDWNMQHLADEASFHLSLGNQSVKLQNAAFSFGSVVWDYQENELDILDYHYIQRDSVGQEVLKVEGSSLKVVKFDYEKLIAEEHYYLDRLLIIDPKVTAFIHPGSPKPDRSEHPLANILKSHFGTLMIRDAEILNAQIDATIYQERDTLFIHLPSMNLITGNFHVDEDSSTVMIDQLNLDIHQTELDINHQMALSFENLIYDQDYNVKVDSIRIFNKRLSQTLLFSQEMDLYNFSVFHYFFEHELKMDSVFLRDADINITQDTFTKSQPKHQAGKPTPKFNIGRLHLEHVNAGLKLEHGAGNLSVQTAEIDAITFDQELDYAVRLLQIPSIRVSDGQDLALSVRSLLIEPKSMSIDHVEGFYHGLEIAGSKVRVVSEGNISHQSMPGNLQLVEIAQLSLNGSLPTGNKPTKAKTKSGLQSTIEKLAIGSLNAGIAIDDSSGINVDFGHINLIGLELHRDKHWSYGYLQTQIKSGQYQKGPITYTLGNSIINTNAQSQLSGVEIIKKDEFRAQTASVDLGPIDYTPDSLRIDHIAIKKIGFTDIPGEATSKIDSIKLRDIFLKSELPFSQQVLIYGPDLNIASSESKGNHSTKGNEIPLPSQFFNELTVFPGSVSFGNQRLDFGHLALQAEEETLLMDLRDLSLETNSNTIKIGRVWSGPSDLYLDSINQVPKPEFIQQIDTELDVISARVNRARLHDINWAALWEEKRLESDSLTIDGIDAAIARDKTLPDPEHQWKPYLLAAFIPEVENINIPRISGTNGKVVYREIGEKTGQEGFIAIEDISFEFNRYLPLSEPELVSQGQGKLYGQGPISYQYHRTDSGRFSLEVNLSDMPLVSLNQMVDPLEAARFKAGHLHEFQLEMVGDSLQATGVGTITYDDLHVEIFKSHQPDVKNFGSELLTLLVDKLILKHSKYQASADFRQDRITFKGPINYWIKSGIHGASAAVMKGKTPKKSKKKTNRTAD